MSRTYRQQFATRGRADAYDAVEYGSDSYAGLLWQIEKEFLAKFLAEFRQRVPGIDYLDFACGTGRVISFLEQFTNTSLGVDISQEMLEVAQQRVERSRLIQADLTSGAGPSGAYDLITAFRFFLNAEPSLQRMAMNALASRLKEPTSVLIFNNHGNPYSHKIAMWPVHRLRALGTNYQTSGNYLTDARVRKLISSAGLVVRSTYSYGYLSAKSIPVLGYRRVLAIERFLAGKSPIAAFSVNRIYVCQREA